MYSRHKQSAVHATPGDGGGSSYSVKLADDDVTGDVTDDAGARLAVRLRRNDQLGFGFGFSAADERPTVIRSVIKGMYRVGQKTVSQTNDHNSVKS